MLCRAYHAAMSLIQDATAHVKRPQRFVPMMIENYEDWRRQYGEERLSSTLQRLRSQGKPDPIFALVVLPQAKPDRKRDLSG